MTDNELLSLKRIRPEDAAEYLQNEFCPQLIRELAKAGELPFCKAIRREGSTKYSYHINAGRLIQYRNGTLWA